MHQSKFLEAVRISVQTKKTTEFHLAKIEIHFESKTGGRFNSIFLQLYLVFWHDCFSIRFLFIFIRFNLYIHLCTIYLIST